MAFKFIKKIVLLSLPLLPLVVFYLLLDPFKMLYTRNDYYANDGTMRNMDYIATELFLKTYKEKKYDSFIFGSSRSEAFKAIKWKKYVNGTPYHFHVSGENIWGISKKMEFLKERNVPIKNALILIDKSLLETTGNLKSLFGIKHPTSSKTSWEAFHIKYFKAFYNDAFFIKYIKRKFFGADEFSRLFDTRKITHNVTTNDIYYTWHDEQIKADSLTFYKQLYDKVYCDVKDTIYDTPILNEINKNFLLEMANSLKENNTQFKILISPISTKKFFNKDDLKFIQHLFGKENVYDFSGLNFFTSQVYHYYDASSHFRPFVADSMLKIVYSKN